MNKQKLLLQCINILGINALFRFLNRDKAIILWYHGICDDNFDLLKGYDERHVQKSLFRSQLIYLKQKGYVFVTMSELVRALKNKEKVNKFVVLTFDDGFKNVVDNAYPIMKEIGAKGCMYLVSSLIGSNKLLWTDHVETVIRNCKSDAIDFTFEGEQYTYSLGTKSFCEYAMQDIKDKLRSIPDQRRLEYLQQFTDNQANEAPKEFRFSSTEQIRTLERQVLEVGSHTVNHPNCANLSSDVEMEHEILQSRLAIEKIVGYPIKHFCYPAGSYNEEVINKVKKYQYESATTIDPGFNDLKSDLFKLKRIATDENFLLFKANISGAYMFVSKIIEKIRGKNGYCLFNI